MSFAWEGSGVGVGCLVQRAWRTRGEVRGRLCRWRGHLLVFRRNCVHGVCAPVCVESRSCMTRARAHTHNACWVYARLYLRRHRTHKQKHRDLSKTAASTEKAKCTTPMARFVCVRACILVRTCTLRRSLPPSLRTHLSCTHPPTSPLALPLPPPGRPPSSGICGQVQARETSRTRGAAVPYRQLSGLPQV